MPSRFNTLGLRASLLERLFRLGYVDPTPIQRQVIPLALSGSDAIVQAETGSGKTLAFGLPLLSQLQPGPRPQALIVTPTRELAEQVREALTVVGSEVGLRVAAVYGGMRIGPQEGALRRGVDIVVGTPGRLKDLHGRRSLDLGGIRHLVLDEADRMLDMGFRPDIEFLISRTPAERQTLVCSATMPAAIQAIAARHMRSPHTIRLLPASATPSAIAHYFARVPRAERMDALVSLLAAENPARALIFTAMKHETKRLALRISRQTGWPVGFLNGNMAQNARNAALDRFRTGVTRFLIATDVAARGLDIDGLTHVVHYSVPATVEEYIHRSGRTGRAGSAGKSIALVSPEVEADFGVIRRQVAMREIVLGPGQGHDQVSAPPIAMPAPELPPFGPGSGAIRALGRPQRRLSGSRHRAMVRQKRIGGALSSTSS